MKNNQFLLLAKERGFCVRTQEPMFLHTTFKIGGPAKYFVQVQASRLALLLQTAAETETPAFLIGNGSNLLVEDAGYDGLVIRLADEAEQLIGEDLLMLSAASPLARAASFAGKLSLSGLEFAQGIPGSVGGGITMNAGAYGGQISDVLEESWYLDAAAPEKGLQNLPAAQHAFGYRSSFFKSNPSCIVVRCTMRLKKDNGAEIQARMADFAARRRDKQPLEYPSAGSAYKRPEGFFAGKLIEDCGLKGYRIGGAQVSEKHAGFIINRGGATCADVLQLMEHIEKTVQERFGVALEREIKVLHAKEQA